MSERRASVGVCIPFHDSMKVHTALSLVLATNLLRASGHGMTLHAQPGPYTHWNREHLVNQALQAGVDYAMFVDTDIAFPTDGIIRLIQAEKPIIGGPYNLKNDKSESVIKMPGQNGKRFSSGHFDFPDEPFEVAAIGTGFMLIDLQAISELERPLFPCDFGDGDSDGGTMLGEDIAFCLKAREAGITIWCHPKVQVGHIGDKVY